MHVATNVDHSSRQERDDLLEESGIASFPRRIHNQRRLVPGPLEILGDCIEQGLRCTRVEFDIADRVDGRVVISIRDRGRVDFNAADFCAA